MFVRVRACAKKMTHALKKIVKALKAAHSQECHLDAQKQGILSSKILSTERKRKCCRYNDFSVSTRISFRCRLKLLLFYLYIIIQVFICCVPSRVKIRPQKQSKTSQSRMTQ